MRPFIHTSPVCAHDVAGSIVVGSNSGLIYHGSAAPLSRPAIPWASALPQAGSTLEYFNLLNWRSCLVDLVGRRSELDELDAWARTGPMLRIRILSGPGGTGKSRLAAELARKRLTDWHAGFVDLGLETSLPLSERGLLLNIDYPEAWAENLSILLRKASSLAEQLPAPIRILLLSRLPLEGWQAEIQRCGAASLCDTQDITLGPLDMQSATVLFHETVKQMAAHRDRRDVPTADEGLLSNWLAKRPDLHLKPLITIAAAIHYVDWPEQMLGIAADGVVGALVARERARLDLSGSSLGWGPRAASRIMGLAALAPGLSPATLQRLAAPELQIGVPPPDRIVDEAKDLAMSLGLWRNGGVIAPEPDIVATELLQQVLDDRPDLASQWVAAAVGIIPGIA